MAPSDDAEEAVLSCARKQPRLELHFQIIVRVSGSCVFLLASSLATGYNELIRSLSGACLFFYVSTECATLLT